MHEGEVTEEVFKSAVTIVQNMPKDGEITISNAEKLEFYGLFKQATLGQCRGSRPSIFNIVERYKWDAWSAVGNLNPKEAQETYVIKLRSVMDKVFKEREINELMQDERWSKIREMVRPHFANIGRPLDNQPPKALNQNNAQSSKVEQRKTEATLSTDEEDHVEEYADACDSPPIIIEPNGFSVSVAPVDPTPNNIRTEVVSYVQSTTQVVLQQIQILSNTLQKQNAVIQKFIEFMKSRQASNVISWPFLLLLFIWPIVVQLAIPLFLQAKLMYISTN
ncbi:Acyl CoA binding protein [Aphelenchoides bicaudatus]|nr:Acyl CoA binding protein [Aphelenchoides bicaudatus]